MKRSCEEEYDEAQSIQAENRIKPFFWMLFVMAALLFAASQSALFGQKPKKQLIIGGCDDSLLAHVYNPDRLVVHLACATITGTIVDASHGKNKDGCRHEADGDGHCFIKLDKEFENMLNDKNRKNEDGNLVFEPMCRYTVTQEDAKSACKGWKQQITLAPVGAHVVMSGRFITDTQHGHNELHPVTSMEIRK